MDSSGVSISGWIIRSARTGVTAGAIALVLAGCSSGDLAGPPEASGATDRTAHLTASSFTAASGVLTQVAVISEEVRFAGPNTIVDLAVAGTIAGTLSGTVEDRFTVVIHPNGTFTAQGVTTCVCTVDGRSGVLELQLTDTGEVIGGVPHFEGRWVIRGGTGDLADLRGVFRVEGAVDVATNLSTTQYSGWIRSQP